MIEALTPVVIGTNPNTYTFTKSLAEYIITRDAKELPVAIFRPSIIGAAVREPHPVSDFTPVAEMPTPQLQNEGDFWETRTFIVSTMHQISYVAKIYIAPTITSSNYRTSCEKNKFLTLETVFL